MQEHSRRGRHESGDTASPRGDRARWEQVGSSAALGGTQFPSGGLGRRMQERSLHGEGPAADRDASSHQAVRGSPAYCASRHCWRMGPRSLCVKCNLIQLNNGVQNSYCTNTQRRTRQAQGQDAARQTCHSEVVWSGCDHGMRRKTSGDS